MYEAVRAVIQPKWSLEILTTLAETSPQNFSEIERRFDTSKDVIAERLRLLREYGLITRTEHTRRDVRYGITERGDWFLGRIEDLDEYLSSE